MSTAELKIDVINKITNIDDIHIIEQIRNLIDFELNEDVYVLSDAQRKRILEAQADETLTNDQVNEEIEEWLK